MKEHVEDRYLIYAQMAAVCAELEAGGFKHVVAVHRIDPTWRTDYRSRRPDIEPVAYTIRLDEYLTPMPQVKALIKLCERHNLTFWMGAHGGDGDTGSGPELYLKVTQAVDAVDPVVAKSHRLTTRD